MNYCLLAGWLAGLHFDVHCTQLCCKHLKTNTRQYDSLLHDFNQAHIGLCGLREFF